MQPKFIPQVGGWLVIELPGETVRAQVVSTPTEDSAVVELMSEPLAKTNHQYRKGNRLNVRRFTDRHGDRWSVVVARIPDPVRPKPRTTPKDTKAVPVTDGEATRPKKVVQPPEPKVKRRIAQ
jgi:hypothetical protein